MGSCSSRRLVRIANLAGSLYWNYRVFGSVATVTCAGGIAGAPKA
jgi:hypothetical protein